MLSPDILTASGGTEAAKYHGEPGGYLGYGYANQSMTMVN